MIPEVSEAVAAVMKQRDQILAESYANLPEPPDGKQWVLYESPPNLEASTGAEALRANAFVYTAEIWCRWFLREIGDE